jgi:hypothetical protein
MGTPKQWTIKPNIVLTFLSANPEYLPAYGDDTTEEEIFRVRLILWHTKKRYELYAKRTKDQGVKNISEATLVAVVSASKQKKYRERDSPPFSANELCGSTLRGHDKQMYTSIKNTSNICSWKLDN